MAEKIEKVVIDMGGREYEFAGGGQPTADSVGSEEIKNKAVMLEDLNDEVIDEMAERVTQEDLAGFQV